MKRRSEKAEAVGFEVDAQTSVAPERKRDAMMRLTRADGATQGFKAKT